MTKLVFQKTKQKHNCNSFKIESYIKKKYNTINSGIITMYTNKNK